MSATNTLHDGIAHLACRLIEKVTVFDDALYVATVIAVEAIEGSKPYVHLRKNGLSS